MNPSDTRGRKLPKFFLCVLASFAVLIANLNAQEDTIKVNTELVSIDVVVTDHTGRRIAGLQKNDFEVEEDGSRQEITHFRAAGRPLRVLLLFDTSFSMQEVLPAVRQEAGKLVTGMTAEDRLMVASFDCEVSWHTGWVEKERAAKAVEAITPGPLMCGAPQSTSAPASVPGRTTNDRNTYLYESFREVLGRFKESNEGVAILMFSDGVDTAERFAGRAQKRTGIGKELARNAEESWVTVYPIHPKTEQFKVEQSGAGWRLPSIRVMTKPKFSDPSHDFFSRITAATGGREFEFTTRQELTTAIQEALAEMRSQYSIAYRPPQPADRQKFHRIRVRVKRPGLTARAREGYRRA